MELLFSILLWQYDKDFGWVFDNIIIKTYIPVVLEYINHNQKLYICIYKQNILMILI